MPPLLKLLLMTSWTFVSGWIQFENERILLKLPKIGQWGLHAKINLGNDRNSTGFFTDWPPPSITCIRKLLTCENAKLVSSSNFLPRVFVNCGLGTYFLSFFSIWSLPRMKQWISSFISDVSAVVKNPTKKTGCICHQKIRAFGWTFLQSQKSTLWWISCRLKF